MIRMMLLAAAVALSGCASLQAPTKTAEGNRIISKNYPAATFIISDSYQLASFSDEVERSENSDVVTGGSSSYTSERFVYTRENTDSWVDGIISVEFLELNKSRWTWNREPEWVGAGVVTGTVQTSMGEMDSYATFARLPQMLRYLNLDVASKSIHLCAAAMTLRQIPSGMARYKHRIDYIKPIDCGALDQYSYGGGYLTQAGRMRLDELTRTFWADITIVGTE